jgi:predicted metalloprotease with PDZ domain
MLRRLLVALACCAVIATIPAVAGDSSKKCPMPLQECLDRMSEALKATGWVGIEYDDETVSDGGYKIYKVIDGSPAQKAGLQPGDVLYALNGVRLAKENKAALAKVRKDWKPGQSVTYTIKREGVDREIKLTLAPMPADVMARWIGEHIKMHEAAERGATK